MISVLKSSKKSPASWARESKVPAPLSLRSSRGFCTARCHPCPTRSRECVRGLPSHDCFFWWHGEKCNSAPDKSILSDADLLTLNSRRAILRVTQGDVVKRLDWILVSCLFGAALFTALPGTDASDTAYNETDTPVFILYPALPRLRSIAPFVPANNLSEASALARVASFNRQAAKFKSAQELGSNNLQPLLCTFLI